MAETGFKIEITADINFCEITVNGNLKRRWEGSATNAQPVNKENWHELANGELTDYVLELLEEDFSGFLALSCMAVSNNI